MKKHVYLDHAAATPIDPAVLRAMMRASVLVGNPSSYNDAGRRAARALADARQNVARFLHARPEEIIFTASGSEANALAIAGVIGAAGKGDVVTTPIEHTSVLETVRTLKNTRVVMAKVDATGMVDLHDLEKKITSRTVLVSVMYANNEIGTIKPIAKIGRLIRALRLKHPSTHPLFHVDACQAAEYLNMNVQELGVDLLTFNGSKIYGPRGIAVLFVRRGTPLVPLVRGGSQESGLRAGTENVPAIVGLAAAIKRIKPGEAKRLAALRDYFFQKLPGVLPEARINGPVGTLRLANNINISIPGFDSENLLLELDKQGISAGSGSACTARSVEPSHVLKAIGVTAPYLDGALRFSLGRSTIKKDIEYLLDVLPKIVAELRKRYALSD